ncbi:hypothetical protein [Spirosoma flavum]|uniref:Uncharacterized protein n=1 Tax=Spirosoma flavum TaxID=2048557 RepID=A0ABW6AQB2_9BACT
MTFWKLLTYVNWLLIISYGAIVLYMLFQIGSGLGHEMQGMGTVVKGVAVLLLLALIGLNLLPYHWSKILVFLLEVLLLLLVYNLTTD